MKYQISNQTYLKISIKKIKNISLQNQNKIIKINKNVTLKIK